jgi:AcrR family transcriptional regulator
MARRGPVPATRTPLSRERVLSAAVVLADENGIESFSMRKLGEALGVEAMSLYNHVASKDDLLAGMVDMIFGEIDLVSDEAADWTVVLRQRAMSAREVLERHRWAIAVMDSRPSPGPATLAHFEAILGCLREAGFSIEMTVHAYGVIYGYVYGFVLTSNPPSQTADIVRQITQRADPEQYPYSTEIMVEHMLRPDYDSVLEFESGLDLIISGLVRTLR